MEFTKKITANQDAALVPSPFHGYIHKTVLYTLNSGNTLEEGKEKLSEPEHQDVCCDIHLPVISETAS